MRCRNENSTPSDLEGEMLGKEYRLDTIRKHFSIQPIKTHYTIPQVSLYPQKSAIGAMRHPVTDGIAVGLTVDTFSTSNFQPCLRTIP
jgi:hypothetical protein